MKNVYVSNIPGTTENVLFYGENLKVLKYIEKEYQGKIKCVYIDPPYNTKNRFTHYDDSMEHSMWLDMMKERLVILYNLLSLDSSIWISIDDCEVHYLKVLCDEIFGRKNFVADVIWQKKNSAYQKSNRMAKVHDHLLVYAKDLNRWSSYRLARPATMDSKYKNPDGDPRGPWIAGDLTVGMTKDQRPNQYYPLIDPESGLSYWPSPRRVWSYIPESMNKLIRENRIIFPKSCLKRPSLKRFLNELQQGILPSTLWLMDTCGSNSEAKKEVSQFNSQDIFSTPKPERLIKTILEISTQKGDIVLDCFAGSGTTGAVAHKMGRHWIMIEKGIQAKTHIIPRLIKVINGEDLGGITKLVNWKGGGKFNVKEF